LAHARAGVAGSYMLIVVYTVHGAGARSIVYRVQVPVQNRLLVEQKQEWHQREINHLNHNQDCGWFRGLGRV